MSLTFSNNLFIVVCMMQSLVLMTLIHVVGDLEKITQRKAPPFGGSFQKKGWVMLAVWPCAMPAVLIAGLEVDSRRQELEIREMHLNKYAIEELQMDVNKLKAELAKK